MSYFPIKGPGSMQRFLICIFLVRALSFVLSPLQTEVLTNWMWVDVLKIASVPSCFSGFEFLHYFLIRKPFRLSSILSRHRLLDFLKFIYFPHLPMRTN